MFGQNFNGTPEFRTELIVRRRCKQGHRRSKPSFCHAGSERLLADEGCWVYGAGRCVRRSWSCHARQWDWPVSGASIPASLTTNVPWDDVSLAQVRVSQSWKPLVSAQVTPQASCHSSPAMAGLPKAIKRRLTERMMWKFMGHGLLVERTGIPAQNCNVRYVFRSRTYCPNRQFLPVFCANRP
jgi:hypothetical protein